MLGAMVLLGWVLEFPLLRSILPNTVEMKANTAVGLMLAGGTLFILCNSPAPVLKHVALAMAWTVFALGLATLSQSIFGWQLGIDELLFSDPVNIYTPIPGRMAPYTAVAFVCIGVALAALPRPGLRPLILLLSVPVALIGLVSMMGYLWNASEIVTDEFLPPLAVNTAFGAILLGVGTSLGSLGLASNLDDSGSGTIEMKVLGGFVATLLLLIISGGYTYRSSVNYAESASWVTRTQQVRAELAHLYSDISDAESAQSTFLLIGERRFDQDYDRLVDQINNRITRISGLIVDPSERERLAELKIAISERMGLMDRIRSLYTADGVDMTNIIPAVQSGMASMMNVRNLIEQMEGIEAALLAERGATAADNQKQTLISLVFTIAVMMGIFAYLFYSIRREAMARALRRAELRRLNAELQRGLEERSVALNALQASELRYRQFIELSPYAVFVQCDGCFAFLNPKALEIFGAGSASDLLGRSVLDFLHPDFHDAVRERMRQLNQERINVTPLEEKWLRLDGSVFDGEAIAAPIEHDGRPGAMVLLQEITERKKLYADLSLARAEADQASLAKSAFLAAMSHEIRTPMNGVIGMVEVLSRSGLDDEQADAVRTIQQSAFTLLKLIDDILDFSKIEAGKMELELTPVSLIENIEAICSSLNTVATVKGVKLSIFIDPNVPEFVRADATRLNQVVYNLAGNAIKFSGGRPQQPGWVSIRLELVSTEPLRLALSITDNGIGMTSETLKTLFNTFSQAESSTTRRFGGSGLGLAISKRLVDLMQGEITVQSLPGTGSTFTVSLPFDIADEKSTYSSPDLSGLECIILLSEYHDAKDLRTYLEHAGARVRFATDLNAARQLASSVTMPIVIHTAEPDRAEISTETLRIAFSNNTDTRRVMIIPGSGRRARIAEPDVVTMDGSPLRQRTLLRAVAVAAGRASPDIFHEDRGEDLKDDNHITPPGIAEARDQGRLILVAEDDAINQKVILKQLGLLGYAAEIADDGFEALQMWHKGHYGLLLTDLHMPNMDGYALTEAIRREEKPGQKIPILALTANALKGEVNRALATGMDEYLTKPIKLDLLGAALEKWLPRTDAGKTETITVTQPEKAVRSLNGKSVNLNILKGMVGSDPGTIREFLSDYLVAAEKQAAELAAAVAADNIRLAGDIAHKLKSSSRSIGALRLGDLCAELENTARADDKASLTQTLPRLEAALSEVVNDIEVLLEKI